MGNRQNLPHSQLTETKLKNKTTHLQKKSSATFTEKTLRGRNFSPLKGETKNFQIISKINQWSNLSESHLNFGIRVETGASLTMARLSPPGNRNLRKFDIEEHRRWMKETWGDRVFSAEEVKEMREAELGDRSGSLSGHFVPARSLPQAGQFRAGSGLPRYDGRAAA
jgi:hypothetical protein